MSLMEAWLLNSANLKGPVPIGLVRMSRSETWQGNTGDSPEASIGSSDGCGFFMWQVTPDLSVKLSLVPEASQAQRSASSGTMLSKALRGLCASKRTRLLKIAMNGMLVAMVDSSWIEALGGCDVL